MSYCSSSSSDGRSVVLAVLLAVLLPVLLLRVVPVNEARYAATGALSRAAPARRADANARRRTARS
jgi:hypothetical protein